MKASDGLTIATYHVGLQLLRAKVILTILSIPCSIVFSFFCFFCFPNIPFNRQKHPQAPKTCSSSMSRRRTKSSTRSASRRVFPSKNVTRSVRKRSRLWRKLKSSKLCTCTKRYRSRSTPYTHADLGPISGLYLFWYVHDLLPLLFSWIDG